jgi:hypothetical protein
MYEISIISFLLNELLQQTKTVSGLEWQALVESKSEFSLSTKVSTKAKTKKKSVNFIAISDTPTFLADNQSGFNNNNNNNNNSKISFSKNV